MKFSKVYTTRKKDDFYKLISQTLVTLEKPEIRKLAFDLILDRFIEFIKKLSEDEFTKLKVLPESYFKRKFDEFYKSVNYILMNKFRSLLKELWSNSYQLGINHQIEDMLYVTGMFKTFDKQTSSNFSSLLSDSLVSHFGLEENTAEFANGDESDNSAYIIGRARRNLTILQRNVNKLVAQEDIFNRNKLLNSESKASRYTIKQRIEFLRAVQEISDYSKKAEASRKTFLGDNYLNQRITILSADYARRYDDIIKEELAAYVNKNIEGVRQIRTNPSRVTTLRRDISETLVDAGMDIKNNSEIAKARNILRTELAIAYNFGKLAGFTSPADETRKVRWNADWELEHSRDRQTKKVVPIDGYEVCKACALMDGKVFTVKELLILGVNLDRGILGYESGSGNSTDFKNPAHPMIPFHPNCSCYWTIEPLDTEEEVQEEISEITPIQTQPNWLRRQRYLDAVAKQQQYIQDVNYPGSLAQVQAQRQSQENVLPTLLGTGLLVGGAFLMSRSNAWRTFFRTLQKVDRAIPEVVQPTATDIVQDVTRVGRTIKIEIKNPQLFDEFEDVLVNTISGQNVGATTARI
jgi:hypothetical protein